MSELPSITVVMPIRNEGRFIERSLGSVLAQDYPADKLDVLVIDGQSDDDTRERVRTLASQHPAISVELLDNPGRIVPTGLNLAIPQAQGELIARVDGHCELACGYLRAAVEELERCRGQGTPADGIGGPIDTVAETDTARVIAAAMSSPFGVGGSAFRVGVDEPRWVDTVAFPVYTRGALERAGLYDEELVRNQDDEYNYRLRSRGGQVLLSPRLRSTYTSRSTLRRLWRQYFQYGFWKVRVLQKHPRQMQPRQFVPPLFVGGLLLTAMLALSSLVVQAPAWLGTTGTVLFAFAAGAYLLANLGASLWTLRRASLPVSGLLRLPLAFACLHLGYGSGFLVGLVRFAHRWGDRAGQVPAPL